MKTLVLDTTELRRDWLLAGFTARLLGYAEFHTLLDVCIPAPVIEELVANHGREVSEVTRRSEKLESDWRRLGLGEHGANPRTFDYRAYLLSRFDEVLSFTILPWPIVSHQELVERATSRTPPFDQKGGGYRDALVWATVLELVKAGSDVALVTADAIFGEADGSLAKPLRDEIMPLSGEVELVRDLTSWLLSNLPWRATSVQEAVGRAQDEEFFDFLAQSDIQTELVPEAADIGFDRAPFHLEVDDGEWTGWASRAGTRLSPEGLLLVEYDVGEDFHFTAELPDGARVEDDWQVNWSAGGRQQVEGDVGLVARMAVLFDADMGLSVEELAWRRADGRPPGSSMSVRDPDTPLF